MEFSFDTVYNRQAVTAMARGLRKTVRKKHSKRSHIFGWFVVILALLLSVPSPGETFAVTGKTVVTWCAGAATMIALVFEDRLNAWFARKRMMPGTERAVSVFSEEGYSTETAVGKTQWRYDTVAQIAEDKTYFIFIFDKRYAQVYDKRTISGGTAEEFRWFLASRIGKEVRKI